jgi:hypothetical protein
MVEKEIKTEVKPKYVLKEVVVQTDIAIGKKDNNEVFNEKELLVEILNKLDRMEREILGDKYRE